MRFDEAVKEKYPHPGFPETTNTDKRIKIVSYKDFRPKKHIKRKRKLFRHIKAVLSVHERAEVERERAKAKREHAEEKAREKFHEKKKPVKHVQKPIRKPAKKKKK
jgi:hypothetical protein